MLIAHYPLNGTANDTTGLNGPMDLANTPFQNGGIFCNGIYDDGATPNACDARTPVLGALSFQSLAIRAEFKINEYPSVRMPVVVADPIGFRWLYVFIDGDSTIGFGSDSDFDLVPSTHIKPTLQQWHTVTVTWDSTSSQMTLYLDAAALDSATLTLQHGDSRHVGITHGGVGKTFKGWLRNLKIYSFSTTTGVAGAETGIPGGYVLRQNYPNPFNPNTTIAYNIAQAGDVSILIYNALGERVRELKAGVLAQGVYRMNWDGRDEHGYVVPSGVYYYRLVVSGQGRSARRMLLLK